MTMLAPIRTAKLTVDQFFQLGDDPAGVHLELVDGEIVVSPSPSRSHAEIVLALAYAIETHIRSQKLGKIYLDTDIIFSTPTARRPDIAFYSHAKLKRMKGDHLTLPPDLCIEVVSPSNEDDDRINKFQLYQKHGVSHYWIVDPEARTFEHFALTNKRYSLKATGHDYETACFPPFADLAISLADLWAS